MYAIIDFMNITTIVLRFSFYFVFPMIQVHRINSYSQISFHCDSAIFTNEPFLCCRICKYVNGSSYYVDFNPFQRINTLTNASLYFDVSQYSSVVRYLKVLKLTLEAPITQNGQTQSNNLLAIANECFDCVWPFCGVGA